MLLGEHSYKQGAAAVPSLVSTATTRIPATSTLAFKHLRNVHMYKWVLVNAHTCPSVWH